MFALTKKTGYAIIALCRMAQRPEELCTAREIAEQFNMPTALLMNVLKTMNQGALIHSFRGVKGGYRLAQPADQITLSDIITVVEGPLRFVQCAAGTRGETPDCVLLDHCPVTKPINKLHAKLNDFLKHVTLAQIAYDEDYGNSGRACLRAGAETKSEQT